MGPSTLVSSNGEITRSRFIYPTATDDFLLAGFARQIKGTSNGSGWDHLYDLSYFFGFLVAFLVYWGLSVTAPSDVQSIDSSIEPKLHADGSESA